MCGHACLLVFSDWALVQAPASLTHYESENSPSSNYGSPCPDPSSRAPQAHFCNSHASLLKKSAVAQTDEHSSRQQPDKVELTDHCARRDHLTSSSAGHHNSPKPGKAPPRGTCPVQVRIAVSRLTTVVQRSTPSDAARHPLWYGHSGSNCQKIYFAICTSALTVLASIADTCQCEGVYSLQSHFRALTTLRINTQLCGIAISCPCIRAVLHGTLNNDSSWSDKLSTKSQFLGDLSGLSTSIWPVARLP